MWNLKITTNSVDLLNKTIFELAMNSYMVRVIISYSSSENLNENRS